MSEAIDEVSTSGIGSASERFVESDGARIRYVDHDVDAATVDVADADSDVAPILFVPGTTDVAEDYRAITAHTRRRTIVVELRGHGRSVATTGWTFDDHVRDIDAVVAAAIDGPFHLMTFSRGTCYALGWCALGGASAGRVRSVTIGDYPAREIGLTVETAANLLQSTWRGTPVTERVDPSAFEQIAAASSARALWDVLAGLDVPIAVVRSTATVPLSDADWERYGAVDANIRRIRYSESPHDIFRPDRGRFPRLVAEMAAEGDRRADGRETRSPKPADRTC